MNNIVHQRAGSFVQNPATTPHKGFLSGVMQPEERLKTYRFSPQWQCIASQGPRKPGNHRPHYSADCQRAITPCHPAPTASPSSTKFNKIKGHGNPVFNLCCFLSQRKKPVITDGYVIF